MKKSLKLNSHLDHYNPDLVCIKHQATQPDINSALFTNNFPYNQSQDSFQSTKQKEADDFCNQGTSNKSLQFYNPIQVCLESTQIAHQPNLDE